MNTFSDRLAEAVQNSGLANSDIISHLKLKSRSGLKKWLDGVGKPDAENAVKLALLLGVSVEWLVLGTGERTREKTKETSKDGEKKPTKADSYLSAPIGVFISEIDKSIRIDSENRTVDVSEILKSLPQPPNDHQWIKIKEHYERAGFQLVASLKW